jgi:type I restriction enzyme S subunit
MNDLPKGWSEKPLGVLSILRRGITYSTEMLVEEGDGLPYVNMKSFKKGGGFNKNGLKFFKDVYLKDDLATGEDLLIANTDVTLDGDIVGIPAYLPIHIRQNPVLFSHHVTRIKFLANEISSHYLYYLLNIDEYRRWMHKYARGTTVMMLDMTAIKRIPIRYPTSRNSQKAIVKQLEVCDEIIEKTEALIHKYQQIRAGLMHDLFSRGLTADGKLRPPREQAPELYQETTIGWIPKEWAVDQLANLLAPVANNLRSGPFGSSLLKAELVEDGIPFLGIDNIHVEEFVSVFRRFVSDRKFTELNKYAVKSKDVVITIMGTVGRSAVIPNDLGNALSSKHLWTMTFNQDKVIPELICWQLNYASWVKAWFRRETQGGIMDAIQSKTLKTLWLPIPSLLEQERIFGRYNAISLTIQGEKDNLEKLQKQKFGLMYDLLTGKVPVTINQAEPVHV